MSTVINRWLTTLSDTDRSYATNLIDRNVHRPEILLARLSTMMFPTSLTYGDVIAYISRVEVDLNEDHIYVLRKLLKFQSGIVDQLQQDIEAYLEVGSYDAGEEDEDGNQSHRGVSRFYRPIAAISREVRATAEAISKYTAAETKRHYFLSGAAAARRKYMAHKSVRDTSVEQLCLDIWTEVTLETAGESAEIPL